MNSYAQFQQDSHLLTKIYPEKRGGYFVDVGAHDGWSYSNTHMLEKDYGWKGICIEPNPDEFNLLAKRRSSTNIDMPMFDVPGKTVRFMKSGYLSGIAETLDTHKNEVLGGIPIMLQTDTLTNVLDRCGAPRFIDFMSIDTEGSELHVLRGMNWNRYAVGYICVEHNFEEPRRTEMRKLLEGYGYIHHRQNEVDDDYRHPSIEISWT